MSLKHHPCKILFWISSGYAVMALLGAYSAEYLLNVHPCLLCLYQRGVLFAVAIVALIQLLLKKDTSKFYFIYPVLYCLSFGIAAYHSGIEAQLFSAPKQCQGSLAPHSGDVDALRKMLLRKQMPPCDEVTWHLSGVTMANLNALASLIILMGWGWAYRRRHPDFASEQ